MLDIHPPHATTHTWRDFFIHIATIVVGLLIAIGLEQSVEAVHHRRERLRLLEDLRQEARDRVKTITENDQSLLVLETWLRGTLASARNATPSGGYVEFSSCGPVEAAPGNGKPANAVWVAAQSSGLLTVLTRDQIEDWERVDYYAQLAQRDTEASQTALRSVAAISDRIGIDFGPNKTMRMTIQDRDDLARALSMVIESAEALRHDDRETMNATEAIL